MHPTLLKPEILYVLLRHRIIDEIKRRQSAFLRKDEEKERKETKKLKMMQRNLLQKGIQMG